MSTPMFIFQFLGCRFFRVKNPEGNPAKKEKQSDRGQPKDQTPLDLVAEQPNPEVARHQEGINKVINRTIRTITETIRSRREKMENFLNQLVTRRGIENFLNQPVTRRDIIIGVTIWLLLNHAEKVIRILGLDPLLLK